MAEQSQPKHLNIKTHSQYHACAPEHVLWRRVFRGACELKHELDIVTGLLQFMCVGSLSSLHSADEPQEGRNSCPLLRSCFIGSCHVGVSYQPCSLYCLYTFLFWLIRSLVDPTLAAFIVCGPLQFVTLPPRTQTFAVYFVFVGSLVACIFLWFVSLSDCCFVTSANLLCSQSRCRLWGLGLG